MIALLAAIGLSACLHMPATPPAIAVLIDDLGNRPASDHAALDTPHLQSFAFLPFAPLTATLAEQAHAAGKEVLLHLPMEATSKNHLLGPGALRSAMAYDEFVAAVRAALAAVPYLVGVNNHMGSLLTQDPLRMGWLMETLQETPGLVYVDSRTTSNSAARGAARSAHVPFLARDVFLDNQREAGYINAQMDELIAHAREHGEALGIAHPHPETLAVLARRLAGLDDVSLVSVTRLMERRQCRAARAELAAWSRVAAQREQGAEPPEAAE